MATLWLTLLVQLVTLEANRLALQKMRAEMATTDAEKAKAIDEGLKASDAFHDLIERVRDKIDDLKKVHA